MDVLYGELGFSVCAVDRLTGDGRLEMVAGCGGAIERLRESGGWSQQAGLGLTGRSLRDRAIVTVGDVTREPDYRPTPETGDTRSELCAPLWAGDSLWGVIDLQDQHPHAFDDEDAQLVQMVAAQVSAALRAATLFRQLETAAS